MLSIIVPVLNEEQSLEELHRQIDEVTGAQQIDAEIVFVDDGSSDGSWKTILRLADRDERVFGIRFRRNFGKAAALTAGMRAIRGEVVMTMDADLQDDPAEIPQFLAKPGRRVRRGQRMEAAPARPVAQGVSEQSLQRDGLPIDGAEAARPQLRSESVSTGSG